MSSDTTSPAPAEEAPTSPAATATEPPREALPPGGNETPAASAAAEANAEADTEPAPDAAANAGLDTGKAAAPRERVDLEACTRELKARFPALFDGPPKPVKLRIQADIQQRAPGVFTRQALSVFLRRHTGSSAYLVALTQVSQRLDLDGQPAGDISAEHRDAATEELTRRRALRREREQAIRQAQRERAPAGDAAARPPQQTRPPRPPRPPHPEGRESRETREGQPCGERPPRDGQGRPDRPDRSDHTPRPPHPSRPPQRQGPQQAPSTAQAPRPPRPPHADGRDERPRRNDRPLRPVAAAVDNGPPPPLSADDLARRERALLLRSFDSSPLTKANFCALKGISVEQLDSQLAQARQEAGARPAPAPGPRPERRGPAR